MHPWVKGIQVQMKGHAPSQGEMIYLRNSKKYIDENKKSSSQESLCQFQSNLAQGILRESVFKFVQMKDHAHFQGEIITK